jgi:hypothetical protein
MTAFMAVCVIQVRRVVEALIYRFLPCLRRC